MISAPEYIARLVGNYFSEKILWDRSDEGPREFAHRKVHIEWMTCRLLMFGNFVKTYQSDIVGRIVAGGTMPFSSHSAKQWN